MIGFYHDRVRAESSAVAASFGRRPSPWVALGFLVLFVGAAKEPPLVVDPTNDDVKSSEQRYLDAAPVGIDARLGVDQDERRGRGIGLSISIGMVSCLRCRDCGAAA